MVSSNEAFLNIHHLYMICPFKPPFIWDFPTNRCLMIFALTHLQIVITRGYPLPNWDEPHLKLEPKPISNDLHVAIYHKKIRVQIIHYFKLVGGFNPTPLKNDGVKWKVIQNSMVPNHKPNSIWIIGQNPAGLLSTSSFPSLFAQSLTPPHLV